MKDYKPLMNDISIPLRYNLEYINNFETYRPCYISIPLRYNLEIETRCLIDQKRIFQFH